MMTLYLSHHPMTRKELSGFGVSGCRGQAGVYGCVLNVGVAQPHLPTRILSTRLRVTFRRERS
jgi:hypothetical protein